MRYLLLILSTVWLVARADAHVIRRRSGRVRRYAARPQAPRPHVVTGPIPIVRPISPTGVSSPTPPPERPRVGGLAPVVPLDPYRRRARRDASRRGLVVLIALARQSEERGAAA
ncbi:hypothetical protein [Nocardiopsis tropica]|uniref:Uncharacterized protein n=1 Tax=Nocardiopsis tropica TaxID=109330 RepID=A0ABU7KLU6_9ACTN|nr:hypothetical protein [Nocardiopsis umidischolae]MEE2050265.1 hypothetical protein [Nocardiopsis umidischolae]